MNTERITRQNTTEQQRRAISRIVNAARRRVVEPAIVKFEVTRLYGKRLSVVINVAPKNSDGTLAAMVCNAYGHFFVGPRGGIEVPLYGVPRGNRTRLRKYPLIYGLRSSLRFLPIKTK